MLDCIVIGAGPGGIVTTKELLEQGVKNVLCLEKTKDMGGVFVNAYDELEMTGVCQTSCPPISCGVSDFRCAGIFFWVQPDGPCGLPVSGFS